MHLFPEDTIIRQILQLIPMRMLKDVLIVSHFNVINETASELVSLIHFRESVLSISVNYMQKKITNQGIISLMPV